MTLEWTAHPARSRPRDVALVAAVVLLTAGAVLGGLHAPWLTVLAVVIILASVAGFLLPTRYTLSDTGVEERRLFHRRARRWADLRRVQVGRDAALVSPFARPSWLDRHRGLVLLFDGADRDRVVTLLRQKIAGGGEDRADAARLDRGDHGGAD